MKLKKIIILSLTFVNFATLKIDLAFGAAVETYAGTTIKVTRNHNFENDLMKAIEEGQSEQVRELLRENTDADLNFINLTAHGMSGTTPLTHAIRKKHENIALDLLKAGADINFHEGDFGGGSDTPLILAIKEDASAEFVNELLETGAADVNAQGWSKETAIGWAESKDDIELTKKLLKLGAEVPEYYRRNRSDTILGAQAELALEKKPMVKFAGKKTQKNDNPSK